MSALRQLPPPVVKRAIAALGRDLGAGECDRRLGHLRTVPELDVGYRLVVAARA